MTTIDPTTSAAAANAAASNSGVQKQLAGNFDTFLTLLTTQLQNQDPLDPMDSNQFTQQLVEFSQVEQQINTNTSLQTLINQGGSQIGAYAVSYLGKAVTVANGNAPLVGGQAVWNYDLNAGAANTTLTITDANGNVVYTAPGETSSGIHTFSWDGSGTNGGTLPPGTYKLNVAATQADGTTVNSQVSSTGVVSQIDLTGPEPKLQIGPMSISLSDIAGVQSI